jgi:hypothetical protein
LKRYGAAAIPMLHLKQPAWTPMIAVPSTFAHLRQESPSRIFKTMKIYLSCFTY